MRVESLSIKSITIYTLLFIGVVALFLSLWAGTYFRQAALNAQMESLSRIIEVAAREVLKNTRTHTFNLGMSLAHSPELIAAVRHYHTGTDDSSLTSLLDDPFITGFDGFAHLELEKIRVYTPGLELIGESSKGLQGLPAHLPEYLHEAAGTRKGTERLKTIDALWIFVEYGPLHSTLVPIGGLHLAGYIEIIINPAFNLPSIADITRTPVSVFSMSGKNIKLNEKDAIKGYLPVEFLLHTTDNNPAFRIVGYENVENLNQQMINTQLVATLGFLALTLVTLLIALWLFNRFLFTPVQKLLLDIKQVTNGKLDLEVNRHGLKEFNILAEAFNTMAKKVRMRTAELERMSMQDSLTGVANRHKFNLDYKRELKRAARHRSNLAILLIDIDYFKNYNDTYGHLSGDDCLRKVSASISYAINRPEDLVARYGGEEFVVILPDTSEEGLRTIAEKCRAAVAKLKIPHENSRVSQTVTISIGGVSFKPASNTTPEEILHLADQALYQAKNTGRDRAVITPQADSLT